MLGICCSHELAFWFLGFTVCYHDSKSMLPIAFDHHRIMKISIFSDIFEICLVTLNCILDILLCFFGNQEVLFWSFGVSVCYQDYKTMLSIPFNHNRITKISVIFGTLKLHSERSLVFFRESVSLVSNHFLSFYILFKLYTIDSIQLN